MIDESQIEYLRDGERGDANVLNRPLKQLVRATNTSLANISESGSVITGILDTALEEIHEEISTTSDNLTLLIEERYDDVSTKLTTGLGLKVDKVAGKGLSDTNFTQAEKDKLSSLRSSKFIGLFVSDTALPATGSAGDYANVDGGVGSDVYRVIWDSSDKKWVRVQGISVDLTDAQIKQQYEGNPDTNAFTDVDKTKLTGITVGATKNRADSLNADKVHTHTTAQVTGLDTALGSKVDKVSGKGLSESDFTTAEKTKLSGIATGATINRADSLNADKVHTHPWAQVTGQPATATRWPTFAEVTSTPVTATRWPTFAEVTGKPTSYATTWATVSDKPIVQTVGTSTTNLMSQKAVTDAINTNSIGVGQTWQNVKSSRALGTTYTNTTGRTIVVSVTANSMAGVYMDANVSGVLQFAHNSYTNMLLRPSVLLIVPAGKTYRVTSNSSLHTWAELR